MSQTLFRGIQRLLSPNPVNAPIAAGDRVDEALNKLQGQADAKVRISEASGDTPVSLVFVPVTIDGQTVYAMKAEVP